ncbi:MAG: hypothetical protein QOJ30_2461, partial [Pseudonocardiales bacterium]|nr:hypothetical protein [Pseudonocardiales bacterium]
MPGTGSVVAGVDGSAAALTATRFAACEARARAAPLVLMHATSSGETDRQRDTVLERAAAAAAAAAPGVEIVRRTSGWSPLAALLAASRDAAMLVVGLAGRDDPPEAADVDEPDTPRAHPAPASAGLGGHRRSGGVRSRRAQHHHATLASARTCGTRWAATASPPNKSPRAVRGCRPGAARRGLGPAP